ncbi:hypothetical protein [Kitasatospora sp. NPDC058046]|uniref:hypothetical protein n=1 Tax=Kitasatospora sp. NPDC058046 TaxID=3346312 RepID=UPI0036DA2AD0
MLIVVVGKLGFDDSAVDFTETFVQTLTGNHLSLSHHVFRLAFSPAWRRWLWSRAAPGRGRPLSPAVTPRLRADRPQLEPVGEKIRLPRIEPGPGPAQERGRARPEGSVRACGP